MRSRPEERAARDAVARFVDAEVLPDRRQALPRRHLPDAAHPGLGELGVLGANLQGYGCAGMSNVSYGLILQELERGDSGLRSFASVQGSLVHVPDPRLRLRGAEGALPARAWRRASCIGCFGLTEPDFGSNPGGMRTRARQGRRQLGAQRQQDVDHQRHHRRRRGGLGEDGRRRPESVRGFLVEKGMPGFTAQEIHGKFSLRASVTSELSFEDVRVPDAQRAARVQGLQGPLSCLNNARATASPSGHRRGHGVLRGRRASTRCPRMQFDGKPIAGFQLAQEKLADMLQEITKAQLLALRLGALKDEGKATPAQVSLAKRNNVKMRARHRPRRRASIFGANGITDEYPPDAPHAATSSGLHLRGHRTRCTR